MAKDPDTLVDLVRTSNELQAISLIAELEAQGVPAKAFNVGIMQYQMPMLQGQRVMVRRSDLERAREILQAHEPKDAEIDWENVDTGDETPLTEAEESPGQSREQGPRFVCARCGFSREGLPAGSRCPECGAPAAQRVEFESEQRGGMPKYLIFFVVLVLILMVLFGYVF